MSHGIGPTGKLNEAFINTRTFTSPEALKSVKKLTDFKVSMVYEFFVNHLYIFAI